MSLLILMLASLLQLLSGTPVTISDTLIDEATGMLPYYPTHVDTVAVEGLDLVYYDDGDGGEVVLFVHGLGSNLSFWRDNLTHFTDDYRVLAVDLPGYGLSDKDDVPGTMSYYADVLAGFLEALDVRRVHYVGISMGGQIGLTFALQYPERLASLALASPAGIETFTKEQSIHIRAFTTPEVITRASDAEIIRSTALNFADYDSARYGWLVEQRKALAKRDDFEGYAEANARSVAGMLDGRVYERLGEVETPTFILYGEDDRLIPNPYFNPDLTTFHVAQRAQKGIPHAKVEMLEDAGHLLNIERPQAFNTRVRDFLDERGQ